MSESARARLLRLLVQRSYRKGPPGSFRLSSGKLSDFYIDCRATTLHSAAMPLVGEACAPFVPVEAQGIGGMTMGADPVTLSIAYYLETHGRHIEAFSVRKEPKAHGLAKWIEGTLPEQASVVVVDDVATTGGSTIKAIDRCREANLKVAAVLLLVDRQEGGVEAIRAHAAGVPIHAVLTKADLDAEWETQRGTKVQPSPS
jgi:orotate phosphoribosyltransferase